MAQPKKNEPPRREVNSRSGNFMIPADKAESLEKPPDYLAEYRGKDTGLETADQSDYMVPRLALCQDLTPQRRRTDPKYIPNLEVGQFFNSVTGEIYGATVKFIPLFFSKYRIKFNKPIGTGIGCQSQITMDNGNRIMWGALSPVDAGGCAACRYSRFKDTPDDRGSTAPECNEFKGWVVLIGNQLVGMSLKSTGLKVVKQMNAKIRFSGYPAYTRIWEAAAVPETRNQNTFEQWVLRDVQWTPLKFVEDAKRFFDQLAKANVVIDTTGEEDEQKDTEFNPQEY